MFKQNLRNEQPCNLLPKSPEPYQENRWQSSILHSGLTLNHAFSLGHGSIKVLPTPDNTAQQRKGHAKKSYVIQSLLNHARLLITSWQRKDVWKTLLQNKSSGTINPAYLPLCVNQQNTVNHNSCPILLSYNFGGTSHEQQWPWSCSVLEDMHWKEMHQCLYFGLGVGCWRVSSWATSETYCYDIWNIWMLYMLWHGYNISIYSETGVLLKLAHPYRFGLCRSSQKDMAFSNKNIEETTLPQLRRQQLGAQGFNTLSIYLSIYLSVCLSVYLSILSYLILSYPILSYLILSCPILSYLVLSYHPILSYLVLSYPILSYLILSYPILSYPILSYPILSYLIRILSHLILSFLILSI